MLGQNGIVLVVASIDKKTKKILAGPEMVTKGFVFVKEDADLLNEASKMAIEIIKKNTFQSFSHYYNFSFSIRNSIK